MITLYNVPVSSYGSKIRIILNHKQLEWDEQPPPDGYGSAAYKAIIPAGTVPAIRHDDFRLADSEAIAEYLDELFPDPPMLPSRPAERAMARELSRFHDTRIEPLIRSYFSQVVPSGRDPDLIAQNAALLQTRFDDLANLVRPAPFLTGNSLGIADCGFVASFAILALLQDLLALPVTLPSSLASYKTVLTTHPSVAAEWDRYVTVLGDWAAAKGAG